MKKTYKKPNTLVTNIISREALMGVSTGSALGNEYDSDDVSYVKEQKPDAYNVWDDDWSE